MFDTTQISELVRAKLTEMKSLGGFGLLKWLIELYHNVVALLEPLAPCASADECAARVMSMSSLEIVGATTLTVLTLGLVAKGTRTVRKWFKHE
jgi:hypothetical protein